MLVYDVTDRGSFEALDTWLAEMKQDIGNPADMDNITFVVCANKVTYIYLFVDANTNYLHKKQVLVCFTVTDCSQISF